MCLLRPRMNSSLPCACFRGATVKSWRSTSTFPATAGSFVYRKRSVTGVCDSRNWVQSCATNQRMAFWRPRRRAALGRRHTISNSLLSWAKRSRMRSVSKKVWSRLGQASLTALLWKASSRPRQSATWRLSVDMTCWSSDSRNRAVMRLS
ncbi:hypothetical protein D3C75_476190 [compost metagenome]